ncbi:MAG: hypothetical protein ACD_62C00115G0001 [uncultured bacterium]|nr:MAG: hypothetical protein ACD_62C00115G0001 [uncultured bacterium]
MRAYSVFGRQGYFCELTAEYQAEQKPCYQNTDQRIFSQKTVIIIRDFLSDNQARHLSFGHGGPLEFDYPVLIKTGTSQNYRDNWTVAVTPEHTVGVWVGNFNGEPMREVSGVTGAAPIAHEIVEWLHTQNAWTAWTDEVRLTKKTVCALSGKKPTRGCPQMKQEFVKEGEVLPPCDYHQHVAIDVRNGLKAESSCPPEFVAERGYLNLPPVYSAWQQEAWPQTIAPYDSSPLCGTAVASDRISSFAVRIVSPADGAVYKLDLHRPLKAQYITLRTTQPHSAHDVYLDEKLITNEQTKKIFLTRGKHNIKLVTRGGDPQREQDIIDQVEYGVR